MREGMIVGGERLTSCVERKSEVHERFFLMCERIFLRGERLTSSVERKSEIPERFIMKVERNLEGPER